MNKENFPIFGKFFYIVKEQFMTKNIKLLHAEERPREKLMSKGALPHLCGADRNPAKIRPRKPQRNRSLERDSPEGGKQPQHPFNFYGTATDAHQRSRSGQGSLHPCSIRTRKKNGRGNSRADAANS